jgi:hypothetical protein
MHRHRLAQEDDLYRLPLLTLTPLDPAAFALWPVPVPATPAAEHAWLAAQIIYNAAFLQAVAVVAPSVLERDLNAVPN